MLEKNNLIFILSLTIIGILIGDLYILNLQVSSLLQLLNEQSLKLDELEKSIQTEKLKQEINQTPVKLIIGLLVVMSVSIAFMVYSGVDSTTLANSLNTTSNQVVELINNQSITESKHFETIIENEKIMNQQILEHVSSCMDSLDSKLKILSSNILHATSSINYNNLITDIVKKAPVWK